MSPITAERIKQRRMDLGLKQGDLARLVNISQAQVSRYELGVNIPNGEVLISLAHTLETTSDYLLGISDERSKEVRDSGDLDEGELELIKLYRSKSLVDREQFLRLAKAL